jgi:3-methyladenine DNA glycosylase AlkD
MTAEAIVESLKALGDAEIAGHSQRFFKTGEGEYGEGDIFLGIRVPVVRQQVRKHKDEPLEQVVKLLHSQYHEARLLALVMLVDRFQRGDAAMKLAVFDAYLANTAYINNWDLVDSSAHKIVGAYLLNQPRQLLYDLAVSDMLWERRISIIATFWFIKDGDLQDALALAEILVHDEHDLMHKAVGWVLREVGKKDLGAMEAFLLKYYHTMPRTMLRYAIEKLPETRRQEYLQGAL